MPLPGMPLVKCSRLCQMLTFALATLKRMEAINTPSRWGFSTLTPISFAACQNSKPGCRNFTYQTLILRPQTKVTERPHPHETARNAENVPNDCSKLQYLGGKAKTKRKPCNTFEFETAWTPKSFIEPGVGDVGEKVVRIAQQKHQCHPAISISIQRIHILL